MYRYAPLPEHLVEGGKAMKEYNDCTVKAFAITLNTSYAKAHSHLKRFCGRPNGKGIVSREVIPQSLKNTKHRVGPYTRENKVTLKKFCELHPQGRYYVSVRGHAVAIVDGVVYDHSDRPRRQVTFAIRVYV